MISRTLYGNQADETVVSTWTTLWRADNRSSLLWVDETSHRSHRLPLFLFDSRVDSTSTWLRARIIIYGLRVFLSEPADLLHAQRLEYLYLCQYSTVLKRESAHGNSASWQTALNGSLHALRAVAHFLSSTVTSSPALTVPALSGVQ